MPTPPLPPLPIAPRPVSAPGARETIPVADAFCTFCKGDTPLSPEADSRCRPIDRAENRQRRRRAAGGRGPRIHVCQLLGPNAWAMGSRYEKIAGARLVPSGAGTAGKILGIRGHVILFLVLGFWRSSRLRPIATSNDDQVLLSVRPEAVRRMASSESTSAAQVHAGPEPAAAAAHHTEINEPARRQLETKKSRPASADRTPSDLPCSPVYPPRIFSATDRPSLMQSGMPGPWKPLPARCSQGGSFDSAAGDLAAWPTS